MVCLLNTRLNAALKTLLRSVLGLLAMGAMTAQAATTYYTLDIGALQSQGPSSSQAQLQTPLTGPPDQSALNAALTPADRIAVSQGHFFAVGADGQTGTADDRRVRLYGVNLSYNANFPEPEAARRIARRLRSLGVNAVRLHHLDSTPDASADQTHSVLTQGPYPSFNRKAVERLKSFLKALKEEGIYANLNLNVGYRFRPSLDGIPPLPGDVAMPPASPVQIFYPSLIALQIRYAQELIQLLALGNDPQLAMVELRNESSLASTWQAWRTQEWSDAMQGAYGIELTGQWNAWLVRTYGSIDKACVRWAGCASTGPQPLMSPGEADALRTGQQQAGTLSKLSDHFYALLHRAMVWANIGQGRGQHSEPAGPVQRSIDFVRFIADTDQHYFETLKQAVRTVAGPLVPITGTQMSYGGPLNYLSQGGMDYLDEHFYVDHYDFPKAAWDPYDWRIKDSSLTGTDMQTLVKLGRHRDLKRPFVVSEYNQAYPNRQGAEVAPVVAVVAALQDWDGLFQFDYADGDNWGVLPSGFRLSGDWAKLAVMGQSAQLFRSGLLPALTATAAQALDTPFLLLGGALRQREGRGVTARDAAPWTPSGIFEAKLGTLLNSHSTPFVASQLPLPPLMPSLSANQTAEVPAASLTSVYSPEEARLLFAAPQSTGFTGQVAPGQRITVGNLSFEPLDPRQKMATVMVTSLDALPLSQSAHMLVSLPGHVLGSQPGSLPPRPQKLIPYERSNGWWTLEPNATSQGKPSGAREAQGPLWMARVPMKLTLKAMGQPSTTLAVYPLNLQGQRLSPLPATSVFKLNGDDILTLQNEVRPQSPWYEIVRTRVTNK